MWVSLLVLVALVPACYHMRVEAEPISPRIVTIPVKLHDAVGKIRALVEDEWKCRILESDSSGAVLITAPYHFATETGFGQPAGGRKYYTQLRIEVQQNDTSVTIVISPYNFDIRTSYAYNDYSKQGVGTMYKHYPYEEYPGMFDLNLINREMARVAADIRRIFHEYK